MSDKIACFRRRATISILTLYTAPESNDTRAKSLTDESSPFDSSAGTLVVGASSSVPLVVCHRASSVVDIAFHWSFDFVQTFHDVCPSGLVLNVIL